MKPQNRLRSSADFASATREGNRLARPQFRLSCVRTPGPGPRVGLTIGRALGGAVVRNRIRRRLREALRPLLPALVPCDVVVIARPSAADATVGELRASLLDAFDEAGLLHTDGSLHNGGTDPD